MRRIVAQWLNEMAGTRRDRRARILYRLASWADPRWSVPWYNLGLVAKYRGHWEESLRFNQQAADLNPEDEAAWWNLGIAATALRDWKEARRAWKNYGIELREDSDEPSWEPVTACVRLDAEDSGEIVWGNRIDPARFVVQNVPLPESKHRYRDIVLHDGAQNGSRTWNGTEVPVFDELGIWQRSTYSTFRAQLYLPHEPAKERLVELCDQRGIGVEDWSTIWFTCYECSRGNPKPHEHNPVDSTDKPRAFGFGAWTQEEVAKLLREWSAEVEGARFDHLELILAANPCVDGIAQPPV